MMMVLMIQMARFQRLHPVNSVKHIFDKQGGLGAGTTVFENLILSKDAPVLANTEEVQTGSTVHGMFLNVQVSATSSGALANVYLVIYKNPGGNLAAITPNAMGASDNKRFVIHQEMIMVEKNITGVPRTLFKGVIKIPRNYKRNGYNDKLIAALLAPGVSMDYCIQCIYKEFR